jgi:hypothetical protein
MGDVPRTKAGFLKSLLTLDVPSLRKNFKEKPKMSTIKAAIAYTPLKGMADEIYNQFKSGDFSLSKIIGGGVKKTKKRIGQALDFGQDIVKESKNTGGMAYARKRNMGLQMNSGGSVKSKKSKKKSRGTGAAKRGTKFKGIF